MTGKIICNENKTLQIMISTRRLLSFSPKSNVLQADATYT